MSDLLFFMHQDGYLTYEEMISLRKTSKSLSENPVKIMRALNIATPEKIQEYLKTYYNVFIFDQEALNDLDENYQVHMPVDLALNYSCFAVGEDKGVLYVAMEDPRDFNVRDQLKFFLNKKIQTISATVYDLYTALLKIYKVPPSALKLTSSLEKSRGVVAGVRYSENFVRTISIENTNKNEEQVNTNIQTEQPPIPSTPVTEIIQEENSASTENHQDFSNVPKPSHEKIEKLSSATSQASIKLALLTEKDKAITALNSLLEPISVKVILLNEKQFEIQVEGFSFQGPIASQTEQEHHPFYDSIEPLMKKIMKMK